MHEVGNSLKRTAVSSSCAPDAKQLKQHGRDFTYRFKDAKFPRKPPNSLDHLIFLSDLHKQKGGEGGGGSFLSEAKNTLNNETKEIQ